MTSTWTQLVHAARAAAVGGVVGGGLTIAVLWLRRPRPVQAVEPQAAPESLSWLYRDAPDRAVPVVIPAQRRGGTR